MILSSLEMALNKYLALDSETYKRWQVLDGKVIEIKILPMNFTFYLLPGKTKIELSDKATKNIDTSIAGTPLALCKAKLTGKPQNITITGDAELGQVVNDILQSMDIDWEEHLSHYIGDIATHSIGKFVRDLRDFGKQAARSLQQNVTDYLQEESRLLPARLEIEDFYHDVNKLRNDLDRLEAKIKLLYNQP